MFKYDASTEEIKVWCNAYFAQLIDELLASEQRESAQQSNRTLELSVWQLLLKLGSTLIVVVFALRCRRVAHQHIRQHGLEPHDVEFRFGVDYEPVVSTTLGTVRIPIYAYRERRNSGCIQRPGREHVLPLYPACRSSDLLLEWEVRLGCEHPFRLAQQELHFFSHGSVSLEDNTIARHTLKAAAAVEQQWLYRNLDDIKRALIEQATVDAITGKPILYISSDAHALRRYVSDCWQAPWKMANGIRLWCIDRNSGSTVHLGGEFTWGDCHTVAHLFQRLIDNGTLPADGDYGDGLVAKLVWLSDGMPWFEEHILPRFSPNTIEVILDVYHLLERVGTCADAVFGKDSDKGKHWYSNVVKELVGEQKTKEDKAPKQLRRKGHKKRPRKQPIQTGAEKPQGTPPEQDHTPMRLLELIADAETHASTKEEKGAVDKLLNYVTENAYRINYALYRYCGLQIGSGAMESIHRVGSQIRLKRSGARWLAETAQALFNWRMMKLAERWDEFWSRPSIGKILADSWNESTIDYPLAEAA